VVCAPFLFGKSMRRDYETVTLKPATYAMGAENEDGTLVYGYMCKVDFECEIGLACDGNHIYPSIEDLKEYRKCVSQCGIVKVAVVAVEVVQEEDYSDLMDD
jgi:hypothetical protein